MSIARLKIYHVFKPTLDLNKSFIISLICNSIKQKFSLSDEKLALYFNIQNAFQAKN